MDDMVAAGRHARGDQHYARTYPEKLARGDRNGARLHRTRMPRGATWLKAHPLESRARRERNGTHTHPEKVARGERNGARSHPERLARGERNGNAKLTAADATKVRDLLAAGYTQCAVAKLLGVHQSTISDIARRRIWAHVP